MFEQNFVTGYTVITGVTIATVNPINPLYQHTHSPYCSQVHYLRYSQGEVV